MHFGAELCWRSHVSQLIGYGLLRRRRNRIGAADGPRPEGECTGLCRAAPDRQLDPADIVVYIHSAYARPEFRERRYAVFHSGPSATADIEGVLILGAQGVRSLSVLLVPRNPGEPDQAQGAPSV